MWSHTNYIIIYGVLFNSLRMLVGAISAVYLITVGFSFIEIAYLKTFQMLIVFLFDIPLSYISDRNSRKISIILSAIFSIIWLLIMGLATQKYQFYIAEFFNAISISLMSGAYISYLISNNNELSIQKLLGQYSQYQFIAMAISAFTGAIFIEIDSKSIWIISALLITIQVFTLSWILPEDIKYNQNKQNSFKKDIINIFFDIIKNTKLNKHIYTFIILGIFYQIIIQFWQLLINDNTIIDDGFYFGIIFTCILFAQSVSGHIAYKYTNNSNNIVICISIFILFLSILFSMKYNIYIILPIILVLMVIINKLLLIIITSEIHENIDDSLRTTYDSVISTLIKITLFFILPLFGFSYSFFGLYIVIFLFIFSIFSYYLIVKMKT